MSNPIPPALAADAIERLIAKADAQVAWAGSVFRAKEVAEAAAQLTALQQAVADAQKDTERLNLLEREAEIRDECFDLGGFYAALFYRNVPITRTMIDEQIAFLAAITAARTPDPALPTGVSQ